MQFGPPEAEGGEFGGHMASTRGTMFYVCQGSCLCGTVNNRGKIIYCYGDLVPRQGELFSETSNSNGKTTPRDLLAAQLGIWVFGLIALLIVLLLIRKSISSLRKHLQKVTERLPWYHDDDDLLSNHSTMDSPSHNQRLHGKDTTMESMLMSQPGHMELADLEAGLAEGNAEESDFHAHHHSSSADPAVANRESITTKMKKLRIKGKDYKKGGVALRGKNVMEGYRVKEKDMKRVMK